MIAAKYTQGAGLEVGEAPVPAIGRDELLVRVEATSICGTDVKIVRRGHRKLRPGQTIILGHEFVGTVEEAGAEVPNFAVGTRVGVAPNIGCGHCEMCGRGLMNMCPDYSAFGIDRDGSHTEFIRIPAMAIAQNNVIPLSPEMSPLDAALAEPLSCVVNSIRVSRVEAGDVVLIYGAGPMGLLNLMLAVVSGAGRVLVVDLNEARLGKARSLGASDVFNPSQGSVKDWVADQTHGRGANVVIAAVPARQVQQEAVELLAPFGRLCLFAGLPNGEPAVEFNTNAIHYRSLIVTGMTGGAPHDYRAALKLIEAKRVDVRQVVSHILPLGKVGRAYELALSGQGMKILLAAEKWINAAGIKAGAQATGAGARVEGRPLRQAKMNGVPA
jgi:threonine dehydrogenase-like Zn-dependent dehydrogenase